MKAFEIEEKERVPLNYGLFAKRGVSEEELAPAYFFTLEASRESSIDFYSAKKSSCYYPSKPISKITLE